MNSILTAKILADSNTIFSRKWVYRYREIDSWCDADKAIQAIAKLEQRYSNLSKNWDAEVNSEWICRVYLASKMILNATLLLNACEYSRENNLRPALPYFEYYAILSLLRALDFTLIEVPWNQGKIISLSHKKARENAVDHVKKFNSVRALEIEKLALNLKANRELISYRSPSSGDVNLVACHDLLNAATLLAEFAQLNSEILQKCVLKNVKDDDLVFKKSYVAELSTVTLEGCRFFDKEDSYRLGYLRRKHPVAPNILNTMTEGHVEDFFGAWCSEQDIETSFDPDQNWQLIFDIP